MTTNEALTVLAFCQEQQSRIEKIIQELEVEPLTYGQKTAILEDFLKTGISFGINKGVTLEYDRRAKIEAAKQKKLDNQVNELFESINQDIADYKSQPVIKYSKKKYRKRKYGVNPFNLIPQGLEQKDCLNLVPKHLSIW